MERSNPAKCNTCNTQLTVKHIIGECHFTHLYDGTRRRNFRGAGNFGEIMSETEDFYPEEIFDYFREIGLQGQT